MRAASIKTTAFARPKTNDVRRYTHNFRRDKQSNEKSVNSAVKARQGDSVADESSAHASAEQTWSQSPETPSVWTTLYSIGPNGGPNFRKSTMCRFKTVVRPLCVQWDARRSSETQRGRLQSNSGKMPHLRMPAKTNDPKIDVDFRAVHLSYALQKLIKAF